MNARPATKVLAAVALTGAVIAALALTPGTASGGTSDSRDLEKQFAQVRAATAKYQDLDVALADGYIPVGDPHCIEYPGVGGMGYHYYNPALLFDGVLDPTKPELLVYVPSDDGIRLAAAEYMMPVSTWNGPGAPSLFGTQFDGPMPEHEPGTTGDHWDLHAWVWAHNPAGTLATWNPSVTCPS